SDPLANLKSLAQLSMDSIMAWDAQGKGLLDPPLAESAQARLRPHLEWVRRTGEPTQGTFDLIDEAEKAASLRFSLGWMELPGVGRCIVGFFRRQDLDGLALYEWLFRRSPVPMMIYD